MENRGGRKKDSLKLNGMVCFQTVFVTVISQRGVAITLNQPYSVETLTQLDV